MPHLRYAAAMVLFRMLPLLAASVALAQPPLTGVIDFHVHADPDSLPRSIDAIDLARLAKQRGMRGLVLKNHYESTTALAYVVRKQVPGIEISGGIDLNRTVGGINPAAVERMTMMKGGWGRVVWLPTFDAENQVRYSKEQRPFVPVSRNGRLLPEVLEVIALAASDVAIVASGTATLETALFKRPMVVVYAMHILSWQIGKLVHYQPWVSLPNILLRDHAVDNIVRQRASAILRAAERGGRLTRQLLAFSRRQMLRPEPVDLRQRTREISDLLSQSLRADIELTIDMPEGLLLVMVDPAEFELGLGAASQGQRHSRARQRAGRGPLCEAHRAAARQIRSRTQEVRRELGCGLRPAREAQELKSQH